MLSVLERQTRLLDNYAYNARWKHQAHLMAANRNRCIGTVCNFLQSFLPLLGGASQVVYYAGDERHSRVPLLVGIVSSFVLATIGVARATMRVDAKVVAHNHTSRSFHDISTDIQAYKSGHMLDLSEFLVVTLARLDAQDQAAPSICDRYTHSAKAGLDHLAHTPSEEGC